VVSSTWRACLRRTARPSVPSFADDKCSAAPVENCSHNTDADDRYTSTAERLPAYLDYASFVAITEKFVVREFIYPTLHQPCQSLDFSDQFAFRLSGSTTAAIVAMLHTVRSMLADNDFVHVFSFDFSKAFDTVRHASLTSKLAQLAIPDNIYNWVVDFLENHAHCTKYAGLVSAIAGIKASVI